MSLIFNDSDRSEEFYRNGLSVKEFNSDTLLESQDVFLLPEGQFEFSNWCFDGFRFGHSVLSQTKSFDYHVSNDLDAIKIYYSRKGSTRFDYRQLNKKSLVRSGQFNMLYSSQLDTVMSHHYAISELFSLQFTRNRFLELALEAGYPMEDFLSKIEHGMPALFSDHWLSGDWNMEKCVRDILDCPYKGDLKKMYLRSQAIGLFVIFVHAHNQSQGKVREHTGINATDKEKLYFARDYIMANASDPLSLAFLSKISGLNEYKLKKGFRTIFNTSVINFLIDLRLEQARTALLEKSASISEIAYSTGYSSPKYFTRAFKKKFGVPPGIIRS